jgi:RNA ligase-like protein
MADYGALNSATKYPSILTYHDLDPATGKLRGGVTPFAGPVILTEKVNGTSGRIAVLPGGDFFIGSREELLYARGDRIENPALSIVPALKSLAENLAWQAPAEGILVWFLEVYGHRIGGGWKQYGTGTATGCRLFDIASVPARVLLWPREKISGWREHGGQDWADEAALRKAAEAGGVPLVPRLGRVDASSLPVTVEETPAFLARHLPGTLVALDDGALGAGEGIVLRDEHRTAIAKARFEDYARTLQPAGKKRK